MTYALMLLQRLRKCSPFSRGDFHFPYGDGAINKSPDTKAYKEDSHVNMRVMSKSVDVT